MIPVLTSAAALQAAGKVLQSKWFWITVLVVIAVLVIRKEAQKARNRKGRTTDDINKSNFAKDKDYYTALARKLFNQMDGANWSLSVSDINKSLNELNNLNDDEFKQVYNEFSKILGGNSTETLRDWLDDETALTIAPPVLKIPRNTAFARMDKLGLA